MGTEPVVADAGPLMHLHEVDALRYLDMFGELHVPAAVWDETVTSGRVAASQLEALPNLRRHRLAHQAVRAFVRQHGLAGLHAGERASLLLCHNLDVSVFLTDDLAARKAANGLGITPVGSLGVIVRACRIGMIDVPRAERTLLELHEHSTLFVTRAIVDLALDQLRHKP